MSRYFLEVSYKGNAYSGFQVQANANTVQGEVERALEILYRKHIVLTGSSRTDAGVHAIQNYFHFDFNGEIEERSIYNMNALLPDDIGVKRVIAVDGDAHCRFDAIYRRYRYELYARKDPFRNGLAYYFPYRVQEEALHEAAGVVKEYRDFRAFSKRNSQVKTYECYVEESRWEVGEDHMKYVVKANRFLRGMVRGLVGTMLQVGRGRISVDEFREVIEGGESQEVDFSVPGHGLYLEGVGFREGYFD